MAREAHLAVWEVRLAAAQGPRGASAEREAKAVRWAAMMVESVEEVSKAGTAAAVVAALAAQEVEAALAALAGRCCNRAHRPAVAPGRWMRELRGDMTQVLRRSRRNALPEACARRPCGAQSPWPRQADPQTSFCSFLFL